MLVPSAGSTPGEADRPSVGSDPDPADSEGRQEGRMDPALASPLFSDIFPNGTIDPTKWEMSFAAIDQGLAVFLGLGEWLRGAGAAPVQ